jgi:hypothetical protein
LKAIGVICFSPRQATQGAAPLGRGTGRLFSPADARASASQALQSSGFLSDYWVVYVPVRNKLSGLLFLNEI